MWFWKCRKRNQNPSWLPQYWPRSLCGSRRRRDLNHQPFSHWPAEPQSHGVDEILGRKDPNKDQHVLLKLVQQRSSLDSWTVCTLSQFAKILKDDTELFASTDSFQMCNYGKKLNLTFLIDKLCSEKIEILLKMRIITWKHPPVWSVPAIDKTHHTVRRALAVSLVQKKRKPFWSLSFFHVCTFRAKTSIEWRQRLSAPSQPTHATFPLSPNWAQTKPPQSEFWTDVSLATVASRNLYSPRASKLDQGAASPVRDPGLLGAHCTPMAPTLNPWGSKQHEAEAVKGGCASVLRRRLPRLQNN